MSDRLVPQSLWPAVHRMATGEDWPPRDPALARRFVQRVIQENLLPLLFEEVDLPAPVVEARGEVRTIHRLHMQRHALLEGALAHLKELAGGEDLIFLKGCDYIRRLYPSPELRPMQDIDILVPIERIDAFCRLLSQRGLVQHFAAGNVSRLPSYPERVFILDHVTLEVHHSFVQRQRHTIDYDSVWRNRRPAAGGGFRLDDVDALTYHALSIAKDEFYVPLIRFVDLWLMVRDADIVDRAIGRAREWSAQAALFGAVHQIARLFPESEPAVSPALERLLNERRRRFLVRHVLPDPACQTRPSRRTELWRKFWMIDSVARRFAFAAYHMYALVRGRLLARRASPPGR